MKSITWIFRSALCLITLSAATLTARAALADQAPWGSISSNGSTYDNAEVRLTDSGSAILLRKDRASGVSSVLHFDVNGNPHPQFTSPINLVLQAYPSLDITERLIPLGGNPGSFLIGCTINNGVTRKGFCRLEFGTGLSTTYGALGFLETPIASGGYLGQIDDRVYLTGGVVDTVGNPVFAYGNLGQPDSIPSGAQGLIIHLQASGAILILARKSSSAPSAYDSYLYRIMPDGRLDPRFSNGILIGRSAEDGLFSFPFATEANGQFWFYKFFTSGKVEKFSLNPATSISTKVGEVTNLPPVTPWNTWPNWAFQLRDGRIGLVMKPDTAAAATFICIDAGFTSSASTPLPNVYPSSPEPLMSQHRPNSMVFPDFTLRTLSGNYVTSSWLKFSGDQDTDGDGIADFAETGSGIYSSLVDTGSSPTRADSDGDALADLLEVTKYSSNPNLADSDGDGFTDYFEVTSGYSPIDPASKPASQLQAVVAIELKIATRIGMTYRIESSSDFQTWHDTGIRVEGTGKEVRDLFNRADESAKFWRAVETSP
jgi:hypothetical protein